MTPEERSRQVKFTGEACDCGRDEERLYVCPIHENIAEIICTVQREAFEEAAKVVESFKSDVTLADRDELDLSREFNSFAQMLAGEIREKAKEVQND